MTLTSIVGGVIGSAFGYNRENFSFDRKQRLNAEFQLIDMRLAQTSLWREDVRDIVGLTGEKVEVYLTIVAFELTCAVCALCKARCPHGSPPWLIHCHLLSLMSAFMYLFLSVWLGMHAFVAAQAYKVRILTQLVRMPIPTWRQLEAIRTYLAQFEQTKGRQMLRVPFFTGKQSQHVSRPSSGASSEDTPGACDPWGLERRGEGIPELAPEVNDETEKQRHIWLVREAAMFYQTYDAFCRICLSAGTSSLATFFSYFCISYVLTENASVSGACCGMLVFVTMSLVIFRLDLLISNRSFLIGAALLYAGPILTAIVAFWNSRYQGHPGEWEYLMPVALFLNGLWPLYYLYLFRVKETLGGQLLPLAFRAVLYVDVFGWAKHGGNWWRRLPTARSCARRTMMTTERASVPSGVGVPRPRHALASADCVTPGRPVRPEDVGMTEQPSDRNIPRVPGILPARGGGGGGPAAFREASSLIGGQQGRRNSAEEGAGTGAAGGLRRADTLRPSSFVPGREAETETDAGLLRTSGDVRGQKPGQAPWQIFAGTMQVVSICWWIAAIVELGEIGGWSGLSVEPVYGIPKGAVAPAAALLQMQGGVRVATAWPSELTRPRGLACSADSATFLTSGYTVDGHKSLLLGRLSDDAFPASAAAARRSLRAATTISSAPTLQFSHAPPCPEVVRAGGGIQDLDLRNCTSQGSCQAVILTQMGSRVVECSLQSGGRSVETTAGTTTSESSLPLAQAWLEKGVAKAVDAALGVVDAQVEAPPAQENITSVTSVPCAADSGDSCLLLGTTRSRLVHMELGEVEREDENMAGGEQLSWVPREFLKELHGDHDSAGTLTVLGDSKLGVLHRRSNRLHVLDLKHGGSKLGVWQLPSHHSDAQQSRWASICADGHALYALETGDAPHMWRFPLHNNGLPVSSAHS